ncbi:MAG: hypothetical protein KC613_21425, partial [Myxococcales bacterium]|nr:hypothetical protein [Myxococcales bacterium]
MSLLSPKILVANLVALHAVFFLVHASGEQDAAAPEPAEAVAGAPADHSAAGAGDAARLEGSPIPSAEHHEPAEVGDAVAGDGSDRGDATAAAAPGSAPAPDVAPLDTRPGALRLQALFEKDGKLFADLGDSWTGELTTDLELQNAATGILNRGRVPFGAVVVLDVKTGRVLAMADRYDERHPAAPKLNPDGPPHLALRAVAPAASVFKIVTSAALLELGVSPTQPQPYAGAKRKLYASHLDEDLGAGAPRADMGEALADSNNGYFARMADRKLAREDLQAIARRFGFNQVVPFPLKTEASTARVPRNRLERARMAAGFWHTR